MTKTIEGGIVLGVAAAFAIWFLAWSANREGDLAWQRLGIVPPAARPDWTHIGVWICVLVAGAGFWFGIAKLVVR